MTHRIILDGHTLGFAAAHFATFGGDCEPLHGHNYRVTAEIAGSLTTDSWVFDFSEAKRILRGICMELDHKFILQSKSEMLRIEESGEAFAITFGDRHYVMPRADVAALEIDNSTAERLAEWCAERLSCELARRGASNVESIRVGVEEAPGQAGWFTVEISPGR